MKRAIVLAALALCAPAIAAPATRLVPQQYATIQAAIDDCNDADVVIIAPGTYTGDGNRDIDLLTKAITVTGTDPNDPNIVAATIIDCNAAHFNQHWGLGIHDNSQGPCIIAGLTITNSYLSAYDGGGIRCGNSIVVIRNCILTHNEAHMWCPVSGCYGGHGAAIFCADSNALITGCTVANNKGESAVAFVRSTAAVAGCVLTANNARTVYSYKSTVQMRHCNLSTNHAYSGAALTANKGSSVMTDRCTMQGNHASDSGGAVAVWGATLTISNSILTANSSEGHSQGGAIVCGANSVLNLIDSELTDNHTNNNGGAVHCGEVTITGCRITGNRAGKGAGGISIYGTGTITDSFISGNTAGESGGGVYASGFHDSLAIADCVIAHNQAGQYGGGLHFGSRGEQTDATITNCTFSRNVAGQFGGGISVSGKNANLALTNSILYDNADSSPAGESQQIYEDSTIAPAITYSCIQNWAAGGVGNIDADPCFVDPGYWAHGDDLSTAVEPDDPNAVWIAGDYHLRSAGWRWDTQRKVWTWDDVTSLCIDAGNLGSGLADEPLSVPGDPNNEWGRNIRINMGAYGGTAEASIPPHNWSLLADYNNDGIVNFTDYLCLFREGLKPDDRPQGDLDNSGRVDSLDLALLADDWLARTSWFDTPRPVIPLPPLPPDPPPPPPKQRVCFPEQTPVWVNGGLVGISQVCTGQKVGRLDCLARTSGMQEIEQVQEHKGAYDCYDVVLAAGGVITVADEHYFLVDAGCERWVSVHDLKPGSILKSLTGPVRVTAVIKKPLPLTGKVYNLKIKDSDRYFVGRDGITVRDY